MGQERLGILVLGWMLVIASYVYALLLIRGIFLGITQGFAGHPNPFWLVLAYLLFFALGLHLFTVGRRAISIGKGNPRSGARVGWGRMLSGALLIFSAATTQFHLLPRTRFGGQDKNQNQTESTARTVTALAVYIGGGFLIYGGISKGFRRQTAKPDLTALS